RVVSGGGGASAFASSPQSVLTWFCFLFPLMGGVGSRRAHGRRRWHFHRFRSGCSPAAIVTFPVPATSNAACGFPALRFPACFTSRVMGPIMPGALSEQMHDELDSR